MTNLTLNFDRSSTLSLSHNIQALMSRMKHDGSEQWFLGMFGAYVFLVLV